MSSLLHSSLCHPLIALAGTKSRSLVVLLVLDLRQGDGHALSHAHTGCIRLRHVDLHMV